MGRWMRSCVGGWVLLRPMLPLLYLLLLPSNASATAAVNGSGSRRCLFPATGRTLRQPRGSGGDLHDHGALAGEP